MCYLYLLASLEINGNAKIYINEPNCYNGTIEDLIAVCLYYLGDYKLSLEYVEKALKIDPENERMLNNKKLIKIKIDNLK